MHAATPVASARPNYNTDKSATRVDIALLVSALFLQRFSLPFGTTALHLDLVAIGAYFIVPIPLWKIADPIRSTSCGFLLFALATTCSLLLNFKSTMLTSYFQFVVLYLLFTLSRAFHPRPIQEHTSGISIPPDASYHALAIVQFAAQFVVDGRQLMNFYGIVPDFLFGPDSSGRMEGAITQ